MVQHTSNTSRCGLRTKLPDDFAPGKFSVLCGRGKQYSSSTGNKHLKFLIQKYLTPYSEAQSKGAKSSILSEIMEQIKGLCFEHPAFVTLERATWWEVEDACAREKIGCMFRDALHTQYRSSTKSKSARKNIAKQRSNITDSSLTTHSIVPIQSSSSPGTCGETIGQPPSPKTAQNAEPTSRNPLNNYYSLLSSYLAFDPNQLLLLQQQQRRPRNINISLDVLCAMPIKMPSAPAPPTPFDDIPDDLSGIFDDF